MNSQFRKRVFSFAASLHILLAALGISTLDVLAAINAAPTADAQDVVTDQDTPKAITLTGSDIDGDSLIFLLESEPLHGRLTGAAPDFTYTPDAHYYGGDQFTFKVNDGELDSAVAVVSITVDRVPVPPLPSSFYGEIHFSDYPPLEGDRVEAYVPDVPEAVADTTIGMHSGNMVYSLDIPGDGDTGSKQGGLPGDIITFKIANRTVATAVWDSGTNVRLDFHPPQALSGSSYTGNEGSAIDFNGFASDWGNDASIYQWDWENDGTYDITSQNTSHTWTQDGTYTVGLKVTDAQGGEGVTTFDVNVNNVAPTVDAGGPYTGTANIPINFLGIASDPGTDTLTCEWDFNYDDISFDADESGCLYAAHTYTQTGSYTVALRVSDDDTSVIDTDMVTVNPATHSIALVPGWNLVSFNLHPQDTDIAAVLSSISGNYSLVYAWDASGTHSGSGNWVKYNPMAPAYQNSLLHLDETMGFWIYMTTADTLDVVGDIAGITEIILLDDASGWNLVSFPSMADWALPSVVRDFGVGTEFSLIYAYEPTDPDDMWKLFNLAALPYANDLTALSPGRGYWIKVSADRTWTVYALP